MNTRAMIPEFWRPLGIIQELNTFPGKSCP